MKNFIKQLIFGLVAVIAINWSSCKKATDSEKEWGTAHVYMPQAAVLNGGLSNNYPIPNAGPSKNYKFDNDSTIIQVFLGVARTGLQSPEQYAVKVVADVDATEALLSAGTISNGILLPADVYTLPAEVTIPEGKRDAGFYLTIDKEKLIASYPDYHSKKLVLTVSISNPTKYELDTLLSKTNIIIDAKAFMPAPPAVNLITGGGMEADDEASWTFIGNGVHEFGYAGDQPAGTTGGNLRMTADDALDMTGSVYQAVQVVPGQRYELSGKVKVPGGGNQFWLLFMVSDIVPGTGGWNENNNAFMGINTWWGCGTTALDGDIRLLGCEGQGLFGNGIASKGIFTATQSTMYIAVQLGKWQGTYGGNMLIDDVKLVKVD